MEQLGHVHPYRMPMPHGETYSTTHHGTSPRATSCSHVRVSWFYSQILEMDPAGFQAFLGPFMGYPHNFPQFQDETLDIWSLRSMSKPQAFRHLEYIPQCFCEALVTVSQVAPPNSRTWLWKVCTPGNILSLT